MPSYTTSLYGRGIYGAGPYAGTASRIQFIPTRVTNFTVNADKERILLDWDPTNVIISFKALLADSSSISVAAQIASNDLSESSTTDSTFVVGGATSPDDDTYNGLNVIILSGRNIIGHYKKVKDYIGATKTFVIDKVSYPDDLNAKFFGFSSTEKLVYDSSIYLNSTITYGTTGSHKVLSFDRDTRTFYVSGATLNPGDDFVLNTSYYPRLYISKDQGKTYSSEYDLTYTVKNSPTPTIIDSKSLYNKFIIEESSLINTEDPKFYIGAYITFITGNNKGFSRKIINFNTYTKEVTTEYFDFNISQNDVFSINRHSLPLVSNIENYRFKILYWSGNESSPIYGLSSIAKPLLSLKNYLDALDNNYWDISNQTNLYSVLEGIVLGGHSKAELEVLEQKYDFSIEKVRDIKLNTNFGSLIHLEKNPNITFSTYRKRILDSLQGLRQGSSYDGLFNIVRAFTTITPITEFLTVSGWRLGEKRLGYSKTISNTTVLTGDTTYPYDTFTINASGVSISDNSYVTFTDAPTGTNFDLNLIGKFLPITSLTPAPTGTNMDIEISPIGSDIPTGASVSIFKSNTGSNFGTIPYSSLSFLFGIKIYIHGPVLDEFDRNSIELLLSKIVPLHVRYFIVYTNNFYGETSLSEFRGTLTGLKIDHEFNIIRPIEAELREPNELKDSIITNVTTVVDSTKTFTVSGSTSTENYYTEKYAKSITGNNSGISKRILDYNKGKNQFTTEDFPYTIQVGDTFEVEKIKYQTKYVSNIIDIKTTDFFNNKFIAAWYARKVDPDISERVFIEFSEDASNFSPAIEISQNEVLNTLISCTAGAGTTTTYPASGNIGTLSSEEDFYRNGYVKFIDGDNTGEVRKITSYDGITNTFTTESLPYPVNNGDQFIILITDLKRYSRMTIYHNYVYSENDIEIESAVIKII